MCICVNVSQSSPYRTSLWINNQSISSLSPKIQATMGLTLLVLLKNWRNSQSSYRRNHETIADFCSSQAIELKFIPERAPHFGGLWEAAVKSLKRHLKRVVGENKLTFEELTTILTQIEACLNSRPLTRIPSDSDGIEALTPEHFLVGQPLEAIPDPVISYKSLPLLCRWHLCQHLIRQFWQRWSTEYLVSLRWCNKWRFPTKNICVGDIVVVQDDTLVLCKWPLGKVIEVHKGKDDLVHVVTVKMRSGIYKWSITKIAILLSDEEVNWLYHLSHVI